MALIPERVHGPGRDGHGPGRDGHGQVIRGRYPRIASARLFSAVTERPQIEDDGPDPDHLAQALQFLWLRPHVPPITGHHGIDPFQAPDPRRRRAGQYP